MRDVRDREVPDTERGARVRACRSHGRLLRQEGRTGEVARRLPAQVDLAFPESRTEKIARLRRAVEDGTYRPDAYLVARAMLDAGVV